MVLAAGGLMLSRGRRLCCAVVSVIIAVCPIARAEEPTTVVTREIALRRGALHGPGVAVAAAAGPAAREARDRVTALPHAATVSVAAGYRGGSLTPGAELGATVLQDISLSGLGSARAAAADALGRAVTADVTRARLDAAARAALAHIGALEAKELVRLRSDALTQAAAIATTARVRVQSGVGEPIEMAMADGDVGTAHAALLDAEGLQVEALAELRFSLGMDVAAPLEPIGDLYAADDRPVADASVARVAVDDRVPALASVKARAELAAQETRLTAAALAPAFGLGASYLREGTGDQIVTGIVSIPIPFVSPGAFETARQRANEDAARAQVERTRAEVERNVRLAWHDRHHWREVRDALEREAVAPMREALRLSRVQYEVGTQDITGVLMARQRLVATEEQLAHAAAEVQRADIRFGHATATLLPRTAAGP